jgi:hypothetical protein
MAVAHASEPAISELAEHIPNMHLAVDVSNLDDGESLHIPAKFWIPRARTAAEPGMVRMLTPNPHAESSRRILTWA